MTDIEQDAELLKIIEEVFNQKIPFNRVLGLRVHSLNYDNPSIRFDMRPELVGNFMRGNLHGGVISSVIDVTGGMAAFLGIQHKMRDEELQKKLDRFAKLGTIDLRVDYLRPGFGQWFEATGFILRTGNKVAVTRIELKNDKGELIATGTGAYVVA